MPGTIQVSVLEFKNISSSSPSSISLWVSMGQRAYQTWDKGDFSFPLTTFRENLVVKIRDAEGNEISRTEVQTLSIVEKGYWDDIFQLEGGYVHMKLQFILTEDDRNRIRNVRESALKKKQEKVPSAIPIKKEFSDRSESTSSSPVNERVGIYHSEPDRPSAEKLQNQLISDYFSGKPVNEQDTQSTLKVDVSAKQESVSLKKIDDTSKKLEDKGAQSMLKIDVAAKEVAMSRNKIIDLSNKPEDQGVSEKTPSSVRKMISAFETGLVQKKGRRSLTRTRASKSQPNLVGIGRSLKDLDPEDTARPYKTSVLRLERSLDTENLPESQRNIDKRGESNSPEQDIVGTRQPVYVEQLKQSSASIVPSKEAASGQQETFRSAKKESTTGATSPVDLMGGERSFREQDVARTGRPVFHENLKQSGANIVLFNEAGSSKPESNTVDLMRLTNLETATSSQRVNVADSDIGKANNIAADQDHSSDASVTEERNRGTRSETLPEINFERASSNDQKQKLIAYCENEHYDSENSGVWIFPDNKKRLCTTTAGENVVHLLEECRIGADGHQRKKRPSTHEITGKRGFFQRSDSIIKRERETPQKPRKSESESSGKNGSSGPFKQVIKIAVVVGFGILVLLTRQKETRKSDKKPKDFIFTSPDFMDQLASSKEQWSLLRADGD